MNPEAELVERLLATANDTLAKIAELKIEDAWRYKPDTQYLVIPFTYQAMKCAVVGFSTFEAGNFSVAASLARTALDQAVYARWLTRDADALKLHEANIEFHRKSYGKDFIERFQDKMDQERIERISRIDYGEREILNAKRVFDSMGFQEDLYVPWRLVTQFVHPADYLVGVFWEWSENTTNPNGVYDHKIIIWKILADAIVISLDAFGTIQKDQEAKDLAESLYPQVGIFHAK